MVMTCNHISLNSLLWILGCSQRCFRKCSMCTLQVFFFFFCMTTMKALHPQSCKKHFIFTPGEIFCLLCKLAEKCCCTRQTSLDLPQFCSNSFKCVVSSVSQRQTGSVLGCRGNLVWRDGNATLINAAFGLGLLFSLWSAAPIVYHDTHSNG